MPADSSDAGFGPSNKTVLRPQPGGSVGRAGAGAGAAGAAGAVPSGAGTFSGSSGIASPPAPGPWPGAGTNREGHPLPGESASRAAAAPGVGEFITGGGNPLLAAAGPLLALGASVGSMVYQADVEGLRGQAIEAVKAFEARARAAGVAAEDATVARYILCTFLDSAIFQTPWGGQNAWGAKSLLLTFHNEAQGGEKFFRILERLRQEPARYLDLLELQYVCLALGFEGRYRLEPNGRVAVQALQDELYRLIRSHRPAIGAALSAHWQGVREPRTTAWRLVPWWVVGAGAACIVLGVLIALRASLSERAAPVLASLAVRGVETGYEAPPTPRPVGRLKQLLAPEESAGLLSVEEFGKRTVITIRIPDLFASGSASVAPGHAALFAAIARALQAVPGRIIVIGHTDDQPVHSFRFADNFALSRARAISVARLLKPQLSDFSRVEWTGLGSTEPRYLPASIPANRARNRRVEIVHIAP